MKPQNKVKWCVITEYERCTKDWVRSVALTETEVEELWEEYEEDLQNYLYEFREGQVQTNIEPDYSRDYESYSVAAKCPDSSWVGWTYWFGGGKFGDPESIDWIEYTYNLDVIEEEKLVVIQTFTKNRI